MNIASRKLTGVPSLPQGDTEEEVNIDLRSDAFESKTSLPSTPQSPRSPKRPTFGKTLTGLSTHSSSSDHLRSKNQPKLGSLRRSTTALSSLSRTTGQSEASAVPEGLHIGGLRGMSTVSYNVHWHVHDDYEFQEKLGEGGFGKVFRAKHKRTGEIYAIKCVPAISVKDVERYERELKVFERLRNSYLVVLHEIFKDSTNLYLVMDLCSGGDLMDYLMGYWSDPAYPERRFALEEYPTLCTGLPWRDVAKMLWQMLAGIAYMHHHRFLHRDIKLENYMLKARAAEPEVRLCDFGLSIRLAKGEKATGVAGTLMYMAPEVLKGAYDFKADIWSIGVCAYVLTTLGSPWGSTTEAEDLKALIMGGIRKPWPKVGMEQDLTEFTDALLTMDASQRPGAKSLFANSQWLKKFGAPKRGASCCPVS